MATAVDVRLILDNLRDYYRDKDQQPRKLSEFQIAVYLDGLVEFSADALEQAARRWMRASKWFPALSDLRETLIPPQDHTALANVAWSMVERAIRSVGAYGDVQFEDAAVGEAVRQVFGSWQQACQFEWDSPGWAIRRQTFLSVFPLIAAKGSMAQVTLRGIPATASPAPRLIAHHPLMPDVRPALPEPDHSKVALAEVTRRFAALQSGRTKLDKAISG